MKKIRRSEPDIRAGFINVTPIVDVAFCLVLFCMVALNILLTAGIKVLETKANAQYGKTVLEENVRLTLTKDNKIMIGYKEVSRNELFKELLKRIPRTKDQMVIINADDENYCGQVVELMDISKKSGAKRIALINHKETVVAKL
jgi:biopolymer transport protein TolR